MKNRILAFGAILALVISPVFAITYLDYAEILADNDIIVKREYPIDYRVDDNVWRQEVIGMAVKIHPNIKLDDHSCAGIYNDVTTTTPNTWVCRAAEAAAAYGILTKWEGYPVTRIGVKPEQNITRAEALAMIWDALDKERADDNATVGYSFSSDTVAWQKRLLAAAYEAWVISSTADFGPNVFASRGEIFEIIAKLKGFVSLDAPTTPDPSDIFSAEIDRILEEVLSEWDDV